MSNLTTITPVSTFVAFAEVKPWDGDPATLKFWICHFCAWYKETRRMKFDEDTKKACQYVLLSLRGKRASYAEMKLNELELAELDEEHFFNKAMLMSLLVNLQEFFKVKMSAHQAL